MKIKELRLKNFKAYREPSPIKFSCNKEKNVTLIYGVMGAGKTSLFQAMNWGLYGEKVEGKDNIIKDLHGIAGKYLLDELDDNERGEVSVEIDFEHDGYDYSIIRIAYFSKKNNKLVYQRGNDNIKLHVVSDTSEAKTYGTEEKESIFRIISNILPFSSCQYFLFDGEKLDNFSKIEQEVEISNAIRQVLGLTDLVHATHNLEKVKRTLSEKYGKLENSEEVQRCNKLITDIEITENENLLKKAKLIDKLTEITHNFKKNEEKLNSFKEEIEKIKKRQVLESEKTRQENELKIKRKGLRELLTSAYECYADSIFTDSIGLLDKWQKNGKFPAEFYNVDFIEKILSQRKCFFWSFTKGSKEEIFFNKELKRLKSWDRNTQENLTKLFGDFKEHRSQGKYLYASIKEEHKKFIIIHERIEELKYQLTEINKEIKSNISDEEMKSCEELRVQLIKDKDASTLAIHKIEANNDDLKNDKDKLEKHLLKINATTKEGQIVKKRISLVKSAIEFTEKLHEYYAQERRKQVETLTRELFKSIFWKKSHFEDVDLTKDYRLVVSDRWDEEGRDTFSAGEREVLSLCFVAALAKSASKDAPFIIDTPFARISKKPTENIAKFLPQHLNQLILFITDKELTKEAEDYLEKKCEYEWTISFDQKSSEADIIKGKNVSYK